MKWVVQNNRFAEMNLSLTTATTAVFTHNPLFSLSRPRSAAHRIMQISSGGYHSITEESQNITRLLVLLHIISKHNFYAVLSVSWLNWVGNETWLNTGCWNHHNDSCFCRQSGVHCKSSFYVLYIKMYYICLFIRWIK